MSNYQKKKPGTVGSLLPHWKIAGYPKKKTYFIKYADGSTQFVLEEDIKVNDPLFLVVLELAKYSLIDPNSKNIVRELKGCKCYANHKPVYGTHGFCLGKRMYDESK